MFCEAYERKLKDAAAGESLSSELRQHLRVCPSCATEWEAEQALFATMDQCLQQTVSVDARASLIAGVRQRVTATEPVTTWWKPALGLAATALVGLIAIRVARHNPDSRRVSERTASEAPAPWPSMEASTVGASKTIAPDEELPERRVLWVGAGNQVSGIRRSIPAEILVSPTEAAGLQQYEQRLRTASAHLGAREEVKNGGLFEIRNVEFAEIDLGVVTISPLDGAK
jgi:hypothetical protein